MQTIRYILHRNNFSSGTVRSLPPNPSKPAYMRNAVHLGRAVLRLIGSRVFEILSVLGLDGLGRFSMNQQPMQPRSSASHPGK